MKSKIGRVEQLEAVQLERWRKAWNSLFSHSEPWIDYKVEALREKIKGLSQIEKDALDERLLQEISMNPVLKDWDNRPLDEWFSELDLWLAKEKVDFDKPNLAVWPWQAPRPPVIPQEVITELRTLAQKYAEFSGYYAMVFQNCNIAIEFGRAIRAHDEPQDTYSLYGPRPSREG